MSPSSSTPSSTLRPRVEVLGRLTELARQLAGAYRPATVIERLASAVAETLNPDRLTILALDVDTNTLSVAFHRGGEPAHTDDPLLQLPLRLGPLAFPRHVAEQAARHEAVVTGATPATWMGTPIIAAGRSLGVVALGADRPGDYGPAELELLNAIVAQAAIALENTRLLELLSTGKRQWELSVDAISQAICIIDANGTVRRANRMFAELVHTPVTALAGRPYHSLLPATWVPTVTAVLAQPSPGPQDLRAGDRVYLVSSVRMTGTLESGGAAVLLFDDLTEKRRLQEQLIQSEKMSAIGQLIAGIAHDLNNPLASVVGFADFLVESGDVPPALAEPLRVIRQEAERAATIVKNLLSFARKQEGERVPQAMGPLLESVLALLRNQLMALKVDAVLEVEPDIPEIEMNVNQIKQVFVNLLNNAAQAIAGTGRVEGGRIVVSARKWLDGVAVSVADNGPGIPEDLAPRVFEPFFTTKPEGEGTGLGLSICQGIVKEHGGRITLDATTNGATFTVELLGGGRISKPRPQPAIAAEPARLRILVVDDEPHILHYMRSTLEAWGHVVQVASDGTEALERALIEPFDAIICDMRMPRLGGREMYTDLERRHPEIAHRVIFATGDTVRGDTLQFLESLGRPFLHKPFTLSELRTVLGGVAPATR